MQLRSEHVVVDVMSPLTTSRPSSKSFPSQTLQAGCRPLGRLK
jgi:hypothetical protein